MTKPPRYRGHNSVATRAAAGLGACLVIAIFAFTIHILAAAVTTGTLPVPVRGAEIVVTTDSLPAFVPLLAFWLAVAAGSGALAYGMLRRFVETLRH